METQHESIEKLGALIQDIKIAMLTTESSDSTLRSRPMMTQNQDFEGVLWFITDKQTTKVDEIESSPQVNISYADPSHQKYISVSGTAELVDDRSKIKELWTEAHKVWFPNGPEDKNIVLLKVSVKQAEYWNSHRLVSLFGMAKAYLKGDTYQGEGSEHQRIAVTGGQR